MGHNVDEGDPKNVDAEGQHHALIPLGQVLISTTNHRLGGDDR